jgi:ribosomal protein S18 acetylase RimI-like enzyme
MSIAERQPIVITSTHEDEEPLAAMIADAFANLPASKYLVPDAEKRREVMARTFRLDLEEVRQSAGIIRTVAGLEAAALWSYRKGTGEQEPELDARLSEAAGDAAPRFAAFYRALHARRVELMGDRPHWHLWVLAVSPEHQGRGYGGLLMRDQLTAIDKIGEPTYLEAASTKLCATYRHFGFKTAGKPIVLEDGKTRMHPMIHEPSLL